MMKNLTAKQNLILKLIFDELFKQALSGEVVSDNVSAKRKKRALKIQAVREPMTKEILESKLPVVSSVKGVGYNYAINIGWSKNIRFIARPDILAELQQVADGKGRDYPVMEKQTR